ncbi:MAG: DNA topoisomerase 4 subunit A [Deltaproteobacteria bacterium]|nr:DNA topoisomerase 4 subunit A [Deltaproteobacteria bacterium]
MTIRDVALIDESKTRYLTYALSVVNSRALPDIRDGLKPVQRRILYAMMHNLHLTSDKPHRKSAAVVGEVLARYHPHGDAACYDALVRMAQNFSLRYPFIDGQGNFGSLDGDAAAAYRYTEARLLPLASEIIGDLGEETVAERDNFDQTQKEPVVLPSRLPNLLLNGATGIAVGMATSIPSHNLNEIIKALLLVIDDEDANTKKLLSVIKGPDFPTGCAILNTKKELAEIYETGRGAIRMRADYKVETLARGKKAIIITSIPYAVEKSSLVEKIADFIIARKLPQLNDIRDESTTDVRIVLELAPEANEEQAMAFLYKNSPLQSNFNVNLTALVPATPEAVYGKPIQVSLKQMLEEFVKFRISVTRAKLSYEKKKLEERIHLLEGLASIFDKINEVIAIVRKSSGRINAAEQLQKKYKLSERQALFIVDLHIYQLSKTSIDEIMEELKTKQKRVAEIGKILKSPAEVKRLIKEDLTRIADTYGDARRSKVISDFEEPEYNAESYIQHEDVFVIVTKDGWLKRIRQTNDPLTTRVREGDSIDFTCAASTADSLAIFTNFGNLYVSKIYDLSSTSGFGDPVQKLFKFADGENIAVCRLIKKDAEQSEGELLVYTRRGMGFRITASIISDTKRSGKRIMKVTDGDALAGVMDVTKSMFLLVTKQSYAVYFVHSEVPVLNSAGKGVILQRMPEEDSLAVVCCVDRKDTLTFRLSKGTADVKVSTLTIGARAKRGVKIAKKGSVEGLVEQ